MMRIDCIRLKCWLSRWVLLQLGSWNVFRHGTFTTRAHTARAVKVPEARKVCNSRVANITFCCTSSTTPIFLGDDVSCKSWAWRTDFVPCKPVFVCVKDLELRSNFVWSNQPLINLTWHDHEEQTFGSRLCGSLLFRPWNWKVSRAEKCQLSKSNIPPKEHFSRLVKQNKKVPLKRVVLLRNWIWEALFLRFFAA